MFLIAILAKLILINAWIMEFATSEEPQFLYLLFLWIIRLSVHLWSIILTMSF